MEVEAQTYFEISGQQNTGRGFSVTEATFRHALSGMSLAEMAPGERGMARIATTLSGLLTVTVQPYTSAPGTPQLWLEAFRGSPEDGNLMASARLSWRRDPRGRPVWPWQEPHIWPSTAETKE